jgi:hypothetical protein
MSPLRPGDKIQLLVPTLSGWKGQGIVLSGGQAPDALITYRRVDAAQALSPSVALRSEVRKVQGAPDPCDELIASTLWRLRQRGIGIRGARTLLTALLDGTGEPRTCYAQTDIPAWWGNTFWYRVVFHCPPGAWVVDTAYEYYTGRKDDIQRLIAGLSPVTYDAVMTNWYEQVLWEGGRPVAVALLQRWCRQHGNPYRSSATIRRDTERAQQETSSP